MKTILLGIMARAQHLYDVEVCGFIFMGNHFHFLLSVKDPGNVVGFIDRIKTESAHAVNRLLGRRQRTIWHNGYDALPILTVHDAVEKFVYIYTNPQTAGLVSKIGDYPGLSSWELWRSGKTTKAAPWVRRIFLEKLSEPSLSVAEDESLTAKLLKKCKKSHTFRLNYEAWFYCLKVTDPAEKRRLTSKIQERIREEEAQLDRQRKGTVVGSLLLKEAAINKEFEPKTFSNRQWCICHDVPKRKSFIACVKKLRAEARAVWQEWKNGNYAARYPVGLFPPSLPRNANLIPFAMSVT